MLFYKNYIVYHNYFGVFIEKHVYTKFHLDWLIVVSGYLCPYCNITSKSKNSSNFKKGNIGMANMHKKQRRQDRDGLVMMAR